MWGSRVDPSDETVLFNNPMLFGGVLLLVRRDGLVVTPACRTSTLPHYLPHPNSCWTVGSVPESIGPQPNIYICWY